MLQLHGVACHVPIIPHSHVPQLRDRNTMLSVPGRSFRKVRLQHPEGLSRTLSFLC